MCNLYSLTKGQQAIRDLAGAMRDITGNLKSCRSMSGLEVSFTVRGRNTL